jgi:hypothetical protein
VAGGEPPAIGTAYELQLKKKVTINSIARTGTNE